MIKIARLNDGTRLSTKFFRDSPAVTLCAAKAPRASSRQRLVASHGGTLNLNLISGGMRFYSMIFCADVQPIESVERSRPSESLAYFEPLKNPPNPPPDLRGRLRFRLRPAV